MKNAKQTSIYFKLTGTDKSQVSTQIKPFIVDMDYLLIDLGALHFSCCNRIKNYLANKITRKVHCYMKQNVS